MTPLTESIWAAARLRLLLVLSLVVLVLAGGAAGYRYRSQIKGAIWSWRADSQRKEVETLIEKGAWERAQQLALVAYRLDPDSLEGRRLLFRTSAKTQSPNAAAAAAALYLHEDCDFRQRVELLSFFDLTRNGRHFMALYNRLGEEKRKDPDVQFLKIRFLTTRGGRIEARRMLEEYFAQGGDEPRFRGLHARLLLQSGDESERAKGQEVVAELLEEQDEVAQQAFGLLWNVPPGALRPELYPEDLHSWIAGLPDPGAREQLVGAQIELARAGESKDAQQKILRDAVAELGESAPELLCTWLSRFRRYDLVLDLLDEERGRSSRPLYDHRLRALVAVEGLEAAEAWLETPHPDSSPLRIWVNRAKLAHLRGDRQAAQQCWQEAFGVAELEDSRDYLAIYRAALELRQMEVAARALLTAAPLAHASFPSSSEVQPMIHYLYSRDRLEDLFIVSERILQREPQNVVLRNNAIYLSFVLGRPQAGAEETARELVEKFPKILGLRTTLALALLEADAAAEAREVLESPDADWDKASAADLAIRALVLLESGQPEEAEAVRRKIDRGSLTDTERRAFAAVFRGSDPVENPDELLAEIRSWMIQGGTEHARQLLREYFAAGGTDRRFDALYAELLLGAEEAAADPAKAQAIIGRLLERPDAVARKAFSQLASAPSDVLRPDLLPSDLIAWVETLPDPKPEERLTAAKIEVLRAGDDSAGDRILQNLIEALGETEPARVAELLEELGRFDLVLTLLDAETAASSERLRDFRIRALIEEEGAEAAEQWLAASRPAKSTPADWISTARLRHGLGDRVGTINALREASRLADGDTSENHFLPIYEAALETGQTPMAIRALLSASIHPEGGLPSSSELTPVLARLYEEERIDDLYNLTQTLLRQEPENAALRNREAYLSLVLQDPTGRGLETARQLVEAHPEVLRFRTTLALAMTLQGDYREALEVLPEESARWEFATASDLAIRALALENAGREAAAKQIRQRFDRNELSGPERRTFSAARRPEEEIDEQV